MRQRSFLVHSVSEPFIIYDMIASDQAGKVESLRGRIERDRPLFRIFGNTLGRYMFMTCKDEIRPDLIGDDIDIVLSIELHHLFEFFPFPYSSGRIMRGAEDSRMDLVLDDLSFHIFEIHAPHAFVILYKRAENF